MIPTVPISIRLNDYSKYCLRKVTGLPKSQLLFFCKRSSTVSPIRIKPTMKNSLYQFSPIKVVSFILFLVVGLMKLITAFCGHKYLHFWPGEVGARFSFVKNQNTHNFLSCFVTFLQIYEVHDICDAAHSHFTIDGFDQCRQIFPSLLGTSVPDLM